MIIAIPSQFYARWNNFFRVVLARFLGYDTYTSATPIGQAVISFMSLFFAFLMVWILVKAIVTLFKVVFR